MNTKRIKTGLFLAAVLCRTLAFAQSGGQLSLSGSVITGGGGTIRGGVYSLSGTIGQPVAGGQMTNGAYSLESGFWTQIHFVQTPDAPKFDSIRVVAGKIVIAWPVSPSNYRLQSTATVGNPSSWADSTDPITVVNGQNTVEVRPMPLPPMHFFRLKVIGPP